MDIKSLGYGAALGLAAVGSAFGMGKAGQAAIGAWKKCYANNKTGAVYAGRLRWYASHPDVLWIDSHDGHCRLFVSTSAGFV